jgi:hypothetical protein
MSNNDIWEEVARLVAEYDATRPKIVKEYRLYYNVDGTVIGLWESSHPDGDNYIVLDDPGLFHNSNTHMLRIQNKKLVLIDPRAPAKVRLKKSSSGFKVVKGHAAVIVNQDEVYDDQVEYYDRTNN